MIADLSRTLTSLSESHTDNISINNRTASAEATAAANANENRYNAVATRLSEVERELEKIKSEKLDLERSLDELDAQHQTAIAEVITSRESIRELLVQARAENASLEQRRQETEALITKLEREYGLKFDQRGKVESELSDAVKTLEAGIKLAEQREKDAEHRAKNLTAELAEAMAVSEQQTLMVAGLKEELGSTKARESELLRVVSQLENDVSAVRKDAAESERSLRAEMARLVDENRSVTEIKLDVDLNKDLTARSVIVNNHDAEQFEVIKGLREECESLRERVEEVEAEARLYEGEVERLTLVEEKYAKLAETNARLSADIASLKSAAKRDERDGKCNESNKVDVIVLYWKYYWGN